MSILFDPVKMRNLELRNRFVRSATYDGSAERNGHVSEKQMSLLNDIADGGVALIITGITYVHSSGQISSFQNSIASDDCIPSFKRLTKAVHNRGTKIAVQLFHAGREKARFIRKEKGEAIGPSFVDKDPYFSGEYRSMTEEEIWEVISAFGDAARRAKEAEFDAVQIHGAHAYLLSQFLSPFTNRRNDKWGGSLKNRVRLHKEIYRNIRNKVGKDYPVLIKFGVRDGFPNGLNFKEGKRAAKLLAQWGFDALEISSGLRGSGYENSEFKTKIKGLRDEAYFRTYCRELKKQVDIPIMIVGGLRSLQLMEEIIQKGEADFISLSRPLIKEPGIINVWKKGDRRKPTCKSCNNCFEAVLKRETLHCVNEKAKRTFK